MCSECVRVCVPGNAYCIKFLTFVVVTLGLFFMPAITPTTTKML